MNKYKLTKETKEVYGIKLHRIQALRDFSNVSKGDLGGWIEKEDNLSQKGNAWVYGDAQVYDNAQVYGNAQIYGDLKLIGGYFYYHQQKGVEIERVDIDDRYELLCKNPQFAEKEEEEPDDLIDLGNKKVSKATINEALKKFFK